MSARGAPTWWWDERGQAIEPIDWAAVRRAGKKALGAFAAQLKGRKPSNLVWLCAWLAGLNAYVSHMNDERVGADGATNHGNEAGAQAERDDGEADDEDVSEAAKLLGVMPSATIDEIRAALRAKLGASRIHPDQGGDAELAKRLIAAKNLLVERAKAAS